MNFGEAYDIDFEGTQCESGRYRLPKALLLSILLTSPEISAPENKFGC